MELLKNDDDNLVDVKFEPAINDRWMNKHIPEHIKSFKCNQDASPVTSGIAIVR